MACDHRFESLIVITRLQLYKINNNNNIVFICRITVSVSQYYRDNAVLEVHHNIEVYYKSLCSSQKTDYFDNSGECTDGR